MARVGEYFPGYISDSRSFSYDGLDVVREHWFIVMTEAGDPATVTYLNGPTLDSKLRASGASGTVYFTPDHLGSVSRTTDGSGNISEQRAYDSFGNRTDNPSGEGSTRYGYTGRELDPDTGLYYYRARWYDPQVGRFI